jgi:hypothetical protein
MDAGRGEVEREHEVPARDAGGPERREGVRVEVRAPRLDRRDVGGRAVAQGAERRLGRDQIAYRHASRGWKRDDGNGSTHSASFSASQPSGSSSSTTSKRVSIAREPRKPGSISIVAASMCAPAGTSRCALAMRPSKEKAGVTSAPSSSTRSVARWQ